MVARSSKDRGSAGREKVRAPMRLVVATTNPGKMRELREMFVGLPVELTGLPEVGGAPEVVEDGATFEANARKKASEVASFLHAPVLADDSGLEVDALSGAPGVHSARFSGERATSAENNAKLLMLLANVPDAARVARFHCVLAVADGHGHILAVTHGTSEGRIARAPRGANGFGYDPLFVPTGETRTMAELAAEEKHARSHRGQAASRLRDLIAAKLLVF